MPTIPDPDFRLLGGLSPAKFLRDYWQKKPLLIRQAIPAMRPVVSEDELFALAGRDDVEARLVMYHREKWSLQQGPIETLPKRKKNWSLLVQGVNLHSAAADGLMRRFNFVPNTRLDDLMISYAVDGGGVGPHFDNYDVFLLQAQGQRRWEISTQTRLDLIPDAPLKLLSHFSPGQSFVLEPGDMLYLPPHVAHNGVAMGNCMTCSIGFRAPTYEEVLREFLFDQAERLTLKGRYSDPLRRPARHAGLIDAHLVRTLFEPVQDLRWQQKDFADFLGRYLTEPKAQVFFDPPPALSREKFRQMLQKRGLCLDLKTQMLYQAQHVFINGEQVETDADSKVLKTLADQRMLDRTACQSLNQITIDLLHEWHGAGWIVWAPLHPIA